MLTFELTNCVALLNPAPMITRLRDDGSRGIARRDPDHRGAVLGGAFGEQPDDVRSGVIRTVAVHPRVVGRGVLPIEEPILS